MIPLCIDSSTVIWSERRFKIRSCSSRQVEPDVFVRCHQLLACELQMWTPGHPNGVILPPESSHEYASARACRTGDVSGLSASLGCERGPWVDDSQMAIMVSLRA